VLNEHGTFLFEESTIMTVTPPMAAAEETREPGWEVDAPDGTVLYLGSDLTLADEIYNGLPGGAHLHRVSGPIPAARSVNR
jgi:hypothetical protein